MNKERERKKKKGEDPAQWKVFNDRSVDAQFGRENKRFTMVNLRFSDETLVSRENKKKKDERTNDKKIIKKNEVD